MKNILRRNQAIARLLRERRVSLGLTQKMVARHLGCSNQFVANWEKAGSMPPEKLFLKLIDYLDIPRAQVLEILVEESRRYWEQTL